VKTPYNGLHRFWLDFEAKAGLWENVSRCSCAQTSGNSMSKWSATLEEFESETKTGNRQKLTELHWFT